jgi:hypothetical protein
VKRVFVCGEASKPLCSHGIRTTPACRQAGELFLTKIRILNFDCFAKGGREIGESFIPAS